VATALEPVATRAEILASVSAASTAELAGSLLNEFEELTRRFHRGDYRPSELSGGRFCEAAFRICEYVCLGRFTPLDKKLANIDALTRQLENVPETKADATYRLHIPRTLRLIYDLRSKRDVAHLRPGVSPNFTDASLILSTASWIVAEVVRLSHQCDIENAQRIVDGLVQRRVPLIWIEGGLVRVLKPSLKYWQQVLVILYHFHPEWVSDADLANWVQHPRPDKFKKAVLGMLNRAAQIQCVSDRCKILPPGMEHVETSQELRTL
jgi:hypothetical protein